MAGYQVDTFQYTLLIHIRPIVRRCAVAKKIEATSFFISCATCLWDVVGHFLGCRVQPQEAGFTRLGGKLPLFGGGVTSKRFK
jgi:hypothetical protein